MAEEKIDVTPINDVRETQLIDLFLTLWNQQVKPHRDFIGEGIYDRIDEALQKASRTEISVETEPRRGFKLRIGLDEGRYLEITRPVRRDDLEKSGATGAMAIPGYHLFYCTGEESSPDYKAVNVHFPINRSREEPVFMIQIDHAIGQINIVDTRKVGNYSRT